MTNDRESFQWAPPAPTWPELQSQLQALREEFQQMLQDAPGETDLYERFAGMAGAIVKMNICMAAAPSLLSRRAVARAYRPPSVHCA